MACHKAWLFAVDGYCIFILAPVPTSVAPKKSQIDKIVTDLSPCLILRDPEVTIATDIPEITPKELHDLRRLPPAI